MKVYAGIDLGGTNIKYGLIDGSGNILISRTEPAFADRGRDNLKSRLAMCAEKLLVYVSENEYELSYIGIGSPGTVDSERGIILGHSPNIPDWKSTNLASDLEKQLNIPVYVGNDANMMALAEVVFGAGKGFKNVICTTVGTGIGGGIILDGRLVTGASFSAAELGHIPIVKDGKKCQCGLNGCLEGYANTSALVGYTRELAKDSKYTGELKQKADTEDKLMVKQILNYFKKKDPLAVAAVEKQADYLALGLAVTVNLLNPEVIIIGGGVADGGGNKYIELVEKLVKSYSLPDASVSLKVLKAKLGNQAGFIGAAFQKENVDE